MIRPAAHFDGSPMQDPRLFIEEFLRSREELWRDAERRQEQHDRQYFTPSHVDRRAAVRSSSRPNRVLYVTDDGDRIVVFACGERFTLVPHGESWLIDTYGFPCEDCEGKGRAGRNAGDAAGTRCPTCDGSGWCVLD